MKADILDRYLREKKMLLFVLHPSQRRVVAGSFDEAVKLTAIGETVAGIHAASMPSNRGSGGRVRR